MRGRGLDALTSKMLRVLLIVALAVLPVAPLQADLRTAPVWYDQNAVTTTPDWHYRVPINVPAGATVNSTIKLDVDFTAQLTAMGVTGTFDINSPRVVRSTGALSSIQEFTDSVYGGATDATGNSRGEVRFILEDVGAVTYYLYFDITQNGSKPANPQTPINGNFEYGTPGTPVPAGWVSATKTNASYDMKITPVESPSVTSDGAPAPLNNPYTTDGNPKTGLQAYLLGARTNFEPTTGASQVNATVLVKSITVPATNPGSITFRWRPEGWDSDTNNTTTFDNLHVRLVTGGGAITEIVGPAANNYVTYPFSPNFGNSTATSARSGYSHYNGFDMTTGGVHQNGMTVAYHAEPWWTITYPLTAFAGTTITLNIATTHLQEFKSWFHVDDIEWSVVSATLGTPQAFGVNIATPAAGTTYTPGQIIPITAQVDANPTAATNPVTALIYDTAGVLMAGGPYLLYNDGTHGDAVAGDAIWSNNGSVLAQPAPTVPLSASNGTGYTLRVFANDAATSGGLAHIPAAGAPQTQANYYNIDEILFNVNTAALTYTKTSGVISDPVNGVSINAKMIPGALVRYCLLVSNAGPLSATGISQSDTLPANITYVAGTLKSGTACATAATVEDDNNTGADESDPDGASFAAGVVAAIRATLAASASMAITFDVTIN
jgi:uncharacterized repeat protein (TIGR01451 family)